MKIMHDMLDYIQALSKKKFERFLIGFGLGSVLIATLLVYYFYNVGNTYEAKIKSIASLERKLQTPLATYAHIQKIRKKVTKLLENNKEFEIKSFFEKFCRERSIKPLSDWSTPSSPIPGSTQLEEVVLRATFKDQTTEKMVNFFAELKKQGNVYIKELKITKENNNITFDLALATLAYKQEREE